MEQTELRKGNLIQVHPDGITLSTVYGVLGDVIIDEAISFETGLSDSIDISKVNSVRINKVRLMRLGFVRCEKEIIGGDFYEIEIGDSILAINHISGIASILQSDQIINIPVLITGVHQLQNLYHSLTGVELAYKSI